MRLYDTIELDAAAKVGYTSDGYLKALPRIARTGIQLYTGGECGLADGEKIVRVYRPEVEVFSDAAVHSYTHVPITLDHPPEQVTPENWKKYAVGETGDEVLRDGGSVRVPMMLRDAAAIKAYKEGKSKQLSVGYDCDLSWESGKTKDGEEYDAVQKGIRANHLAVVTAARGGPALTIGDDNKDVKSSLSKGEDIMTDTSVISTPALRTVLIDNIECKMPDTSAQIVQRTISDLETKLRDAFKKLKEKEEEDEDDEEESNAKDAAIRKLDAAIQAKDKLIAERDESLKAKDAEVTTLKASLKDAEITPQKLNTMFKDYMDVVVKAKDLVGDRLRTEDKSAEQIRREVVESRVGDAAKNWDDKQITAAFHTLPTRSSTPDRPVMVGDVRVAFGRPGPGYMTDAEIKQKAYDDYNRDLTDAWRGPQRSIANQ